MTGSRAVSLFAGSITREHPFSFFCDIEDRHTFNIKEKNAMEVLAKDKHSILGQWGGDMVRNGYNLRLLKNGGSENESLFMYKKNLSSYQHKTSTKSLKTRITFKTTVKGEGENAVDQDFKVVIDSPLLSKYSQIYEAVVEVNDQDVKDQDSLIKYGKQYYRTSMCDMMEDSLEISVVGQSDVAVQMFDVVSIYHDWYGLDVRKKITKYTYSPMAKKLKSIGFGTFQSSLASAIGGMVNDAVQGESHRLHEILNERLKKEIANAERAFDAEFAKHEKAITDAVEQYKAKAEEFGAKIHEEVEKGRPDLFKLIKEELLQDKDFKENNKDAISELSKKLEQVSESASVNARLIGGDGTTQYNKNRVAGGTAKKIAYGTDYVEVGHNGDGFELGKQYVISWSGVCTPYGKADVTLTVNKDTFYGGHVRFNPTNTVMPVIEQDITKKTDKVLSVYYGGYSVVFSGDWYQTQEQSVMINNRNSRVEITPVFKTIADGQNARYDASWNEIPTFIFDGGRT